MLQAPASATSELHVCSHTGNQTVKALIRDSHNTFMALLTSTEDMSKLAYLKLIVEFLINVEDSLSLGDSTKRLCMALADLS
ncbi:hypothetical protein EYZ11_001098 [Aspergillus tanneri]|uniref:Uncharacterized protein n=1 Tax=Aspergillus tanneri TaxID=1220188 RepID=A0A4V3UQM7_9EURO|nr:hypothetical protein EYZ11_001098 [Aspergillus tanneri]